MAHYLLLEQQGTTLIATINDPARRNALNSGLYGELGEAITSAASNPKIRAVVLTGAGDFFCAGGNLDGLKTRRELNMHQREEKVERLQNLVRTMRGSKIPIIAAVEGGAAGAGASLAFACDMIVAAEGVPFSAAYVKIGFAPDGGISGFLSTALPHQLAMELCLTGNPISSDQLHQHGVVNRVVAKGEALNEARMLAEKLAAGPPQAQAAIKKLIEAPYHDFMNDQLLRERKAMALAQGRPESWEGIRAFHEKRRPDFNSVTTLPAQNDPEPSLIMPTPFTEKFGSRLPVVAGGLQWLANAEYVAAAARSGVLGFITAASFPDRDALRAEIRKCKDLAESNVFGVNVSMLPKLVSGDETQEIFELIADEGVTCVETSGRSPEAYLPFLKDKGIRVMHKVPSLRFAETAQRIGVDAVVIVGTECGGHPGMEMVGSFVNAGLASQRLHIPWLIGGGIGSGAQIAAAYAMGASGVLIGTRFLVAEEIWAHEDYKQRLIEASERDTVLTMHTVRNTIRTLKNETTEELAQLEFDNPSLTIDDMIHLVSGKIGRKVYETGDTSRGMLSAGQSLGFVKEIQPFSEIVAQLEKEALAAIRKVNAL